MSAFNSIATLQKLETGGVPHKQAQAIADGLSDVRADLVTRPELKAEISAARDDFKAEMKLLRADFRADLNAMALRLFLANTGAVGVATAILGFLISLHQTGSAR